MKAGLRALLAANCLLLLACTTPRAAGLPPAPATTPTAYPPIDFPRDEAPHDYLTEWWYYTGHLGSADGRRWGFELVTFQVLRGSLPPTYFSHFAITDRQRVAFAYDERIARGPQLQPVEGFSLDVGDWRMAGLGGRDRLVAALDGYAIDLELTTNRPPVLHGGGLIRYGPPGDSYYYSRTRMEVNGTIDDGQPIAVQGLAWCDRQWGNFLVLGGGWDWFSLQLEDGSDVMLYLIHDTQGISRAAYGTFVDPTGTFRHLSGSEVDLIAIGTWTSPRSGGQYPMGWRMQLPSHELDLTIEPVLVDQELDTPRTTGTIYWEGAVDVTGTRGGNPIRGQAYVELTGYAARR